MNRTVIEGDFIGAAGEQIFVLLRTPRLPRGPCVLVVPPFAEEMNKSRRLVSQFCRRANEAGHGVLTVDLYGTGDSQGDFADARWNRWLQDLSMASDWASGRGWSMRSMLAIRFGCLLGAQWAAGRDIALTRSIWWQPAISSARLLDQFLRLRVVASMMEGDRKETVSELKRRLRAGEVLEVAGYPLSGGLADDLDQAVRDERIGPQLGAITWVEIPRSADAPTPVEDLKAMEAARACGVRIEVQRCPGEPFWAAAELVESPDLIDVSARALS